MSQPRLTPSSKPRIIDHYLIPPNSTVSVQAWSLHRNPAIFGDDAEIFCPERWLVDADRVREMERGFLAFGRGGRACTGREYVYLFFFSTIFFLPFRIFLSLETEGEDK